jgi:N-acetylneuraminic acid mutarotase
MKTLARTLRAPIIAALTLAAALAHAQSWKLENEIRFSPRERMSIAVAGDELIVAGGMRMGMTAAMTNDVWSSADGDTWKRLAADPPFSPRQRASLCRFNGKLWLVGGDVDTYDKAGPEDIYREVWSSAAGYSWEKSDASFLPPGPGRLLAVTALDRLWILANGSAGVSVVSTRDGVNYRDAKAKGLPRADMAYAFQGILFAVSNANREIYSSKDGAAWIVSKEPAPSFISDPAPLGGLLYAICRDGLRGSKDGLAWTALKDGLNIPGLLKFLRQPESASYKESVRDGAGLVAWRGGLWIAGGSPGSSSSSPGASVSGFVLENDLWESKDAKTWKKHPGPDFKKRPSPRYGQASTVLGDRLFILGGASDPADVRLIADAWALGPEGSWEEKAPGEISYTWSKESGIWEPRYMAAAAAFKGRIWLTGGQADGYDEAPGFRADVWSSADGASWKQENPQAAFGPRAGHALISHAGRLWLIGGEGPDPAAPGTPVTRTDIYSSSDGVAWQKAVLDPAPRLAAFQSAVQAGGRIWISGGMYRVGADSFMTRETWSSEDGLSWRKEYPLETFSFGMAGAAAGERVIALGGRDDRSLIPGISVLSSDGSWNPSSASIDPGFLGSLAVLGGKLYYWAGLDDLDGPPSGALWSIKLSEIK